MKLSKEARDLIDTFDGAARNEAFIGAAHPEDHASIEDEFRKARYSLKRYIADLEKLAGVPRSRKPKKDAA